MKKFFAMLLTLVMVLSLAACGGSKKMVYAVEAGSAGEAAAKEAGFEIEYCNIDTIDTLCHLSHCSSKFFSICIEVL